MKAHRRLPAVFRSLPLVLLIGLTTAGVIGFRIFNPSVRVLAEHQLRGSRITIVECRRFAFLVFDIIDNRYRFEVTDRLGLIAAYSVERDGYEAKKAEIRPDEHHQFTCLIDDRAVAVWDGEFWHKPTKP